MNIDMCLRCAHHEGTSSQNSVLFRDLCRRVRKQCTITVNGIYSFKIGVEFSIVPILGLNFWIWVEFGHKREVIMWILSLYGVYWESRAR